MFLLFTREFLKPSQIAARRDCSPRTVEWHLYNIRKKGYLSLKVTGTRGNSNVLPCMPQSVTTKNIRLHGEEFNIKIIKGSVNYERSRKRCNVVSIGGNTVRLYEGSLEVYSGHSFWGSDAQEADSQSVEYWSRFFTRLEQEFNVSLLKERKQNIRRVKAHYADVNNALAEKAQAEGESVRVYGSDGKEWLLCDGSWGFKELETTHPERSKQDMGQVVAPFFNDMRDHKHRLPSQVASELDIIRGLIYELAASQKNMSTVLEALLPKPYEPVKKDESLMNYFG